MLDTGPNQLVCICNYALGCMVVCTPAQLFCMLGKVKEEETKGTIREKGRRERGERGERE